MLSQAFAALLKSRVPPRSSQVWLDATAPEVSPADPTLAEKAAGANVWLPSLEAVKDKEIQKHQENAILRALHRGFPIGRTYRKSQRLQIAASIETLYKGLCIEGVLKGALYGAPR